MGDRGRPGNIGAEQTGENAGLGITKLWVLGSHIDYRAVVLAEFAAGRGLGEIAGRAERLGQYFHRVLVGVGSPATAVVVLKICQPPFGEAADRIRPGDGYEFGQRAQRQIVVGLAEAFAPVRASRP